MTIINNKYFSDELIILFSLCSLKYGVDWLRAAINCWQSADAVKRHQYYDEIHNENNFVLQWACYKFSKLMKMDSGFRNFIQVSALEASEPLMRIASAGYVVGSGFMLFSAHNLARAAMHQQAADKTAMRVGAFAALGCAMKLLG